MKPDDYAVHQLSIPPAVGEAIVALASPAKDEASKDGAVRQGGLSLGSALFRAPPAGGRSRVDQQALAAWEEAMGASKQAAAAFTSLTHTSRATKSWALQVAPSATLHLPLTSDKTQQEWQQCLLSARRDLADRHLPSALVLSAYGAPAEASYPIKELNTRLAEASRLLQDFSHTINEVQVDSPQLDAGFGLIAGYIWATVAQAAPALTALGLGPCPCALPAPALLPGARKVTVAVAGQSESANAALSHVTPYLPQLTTLRVSKHSTAGCDVPEIQWRGVLREPTRTLCHFETFTPLTDELLGLLITHAPALTRLSVSEWAMTSAEHRGKQWALEHLERVGEWCQADLDLSCLGFLPRRAQGRVCIADPASCARLPLEGPQGFSGSLSKRFKE